MADILVWLRHHRRAVAAIAAAAVAFACLTATLCARNGRAIPAVAPARAADAGTPVDLDGELDVDAKGIRAGYGTLESDLAAFLQANVWTDSGETQAVRFRELVVEVAATEESVHPYVITACSREQGASSETWTFALATDEGTEIAVLTRTEADGVVAATLECPLILGGRRLVLAEAAAELSIDGPDAAWCASYGIDRDALAGALTEYCAKRYPTASEAAWLDAVEIDYAEGTLAIEFALDNASSTHVEAVCDLDGGAIEIGRA